MSTPRAAHEIVVLGANFGGVDVTHYLLRHTIPALEKRDSTRFYHVTLVAPNSHCFFKIASPRTLVQPTLIPRDQIFRSITKAFARYPSQKFEFVQATATSLNPEQRTITIEPSDADAVEYQISYNSLIISTGITSNSPLWTIHGDHMVTFDALESTHKAISTAKTILIGGGGPVGVETAGEIASTYPKTKLTLASSSKRLLEHGTQSMGTRATTSLETLGVEVLNNVQIKSVSSPIDEEKTIVKLSDGSERTVDLYIDATGGQHVNSKYLPATWLDKDKRVLTNDAYFRVKGNGDDAKGVYVIGDVVAGSPRTAVALDAMVPTACSALAVDVAATLSPKEAMVDNSKGSFLAYFLGLLFGHPREELALKKVQPMNAMAVPIGPNGGVGQIMGWPLPSFMVKSVKAKGFLIELWDPLITGEHRAKASP